MDSTSPVSNKLPSSSRPSLPTGDWWSPPALQSSLEYPFASSGRIGLRKWASSTKKDLGSTLLGLLSDLAVTGRTKAFSVLHPWLSGGSWSWVASARSPTDGGSSSNCSDSSPRSKLCLRNCLTTFQFQLDNSIPASPGGAALGIADFSWFC